MKKIKVLLCIILFFLVIWVLYLFVSIKTISYEFVEGNELDLNDLPPNCPIKDCQLYDCIKSYFNMKSYLAKYCKIEFNEKKQISKFFKKYSEDIHILDYHTVNSKTYYLFEDNRNYPKEAPKYFVNCDEKLLKISTSPLGRDTCYSLYIHQNIIYILGEELARGDSGILFFKQENNSFIRSKRQMEALNNSERIDLFNSIIRIDNNNWYLLGESHHGEIDKFYNVRVKRSDIFN